MAPASYCALVVVLLACASPAQIMTFVPCRFGNTITVGHAAGVSQQRVTLIEAGAESGASVFIPDSGVPVPGILFSHSAIEGTRSRADFLRFALALARAGAASIVLDGTIDWRRPADRWQQPPHLLACAGQWLLLHSRLDERRLAVAGRLGPWGGGDTPLCLPGENPCWHPSYILGFGQTSPVEYQNTQRLLTSAGRLSYARHLQRYLALRELDPQWIVDSHH